MFADIRQYVEMRESANEQELNDYWDTMFKKVGMADPAFAVATLPCHGFRAR